MELVTIRLPDDVKEKLENFAQADHRPLSNLLRLIITEWLEKQEKGKKPKK
jgi:predicted transcriptional regulator